MNIILHLMFALTVRRRVKNNLGISLNLPGFLYGNILPDISRKYGSNPHYMKDALSHVVASKDKLISKRSYSQYRFAKELGAMNHYLSDFFCLPHTEGYKGSKTRHGIYELVMIAKYKKGLRAYRSLMKEHKALLEPQDLKAFIIEYNSTYKNGMASDINDIRYALFAGTKLSESMVTHSVPLSEPEGSRMELTQSFQ